MASTLPHSLLLFTLLLFIAHTIRANDHSICETTSCQSSWSSDPSESSNWFPITISFPFWLKERNQTNRCKYPGFGLTCNKKNQTLLTLPESGDFIVQSISTSMYPNIWINDQDKCLPRTVMLNHGFNLAGSPFELGDFYTFANYSFFNCPSDAIFSSHLQGEIISCLSSTIKNVTYAVIAVLPNSQHSLNSSCYYISSGLAPVEVPHSTYWTNYYVDIELKWEKPDCRDCEESGGSCGLLGDSTLEVACNLPGQEGNSKKLKYGLTIGIPGLLVLCIIGLVFFFQWRRRWSMPLPDQLRQASIEISSLSIPHPPITLMGLDGASIEKYPKTQLGESGRVPNPEDNICSICLCEYQPKETLRTIPECNHYFHVNCLDGWLKMNSTCPLCRNPHGGTS